LALAIAAGTAVASGPALAGAWVADAKSGCQVWNPNPQLEETVTWSGSCAAGRAQGHGTAQWVKGGTTSETDEGEWRDGRQIGKGTQSWATGRYEGELADSEPNGHGLLVMQKLRYEGDFRNGKPNGTGTMTAGGESVQGLWKDGCLQGARKASVGVPLSACRWPIGAGAETDRRGSMCEEERTMKRYLLIGCGLIAMLASHVPASAQPDQTKGKNCHLEQQCHWENFKKVCVYVKVCR
jgi:hypothetical protein